jgi:hypothetical protein
MFKVYLRKESTTDELLWNPSFSLKERKELAKKMDVVSYENPECTKNPGRWMWYYKSKPHKKTKKMTLLYRICEVVWMPDLIIERDLTIPKKDK